MYVLEWVMIILQYDSLDFDLKFFYYIYHICCYILQDLKYNFLNFIIDFEREFISAQLKKSNFLSWLKKISFLWLPFFLIHMLLACSSHTFNVLVLQKPSRVDTKKTHQATSSSSSSSSYLSPKAIPTHVWAPSSGELLIQEGLNKRLYGVSGEINSQISKTRK